MKRKISVLLVIALIATLAASYVTVGASSAKPITLSVEKTYFEFGEAIEVDFSGVTTELQSHDLEIRIEKKRLPDNATYADRVSPGYAQYFDIGTGAASVAESGTVTFQDGGVRHPTAGGTASIPAGAYTLWVIDFTTLQPCSNQINIDVGLMTISTTKTTFVQGEDIVVSFDGLLETMGGTNKDVELRLDQGHNLAWDFNSRPGSKGYADMLKSDVDGSDIFEGTSGSKTFPADDVRVTNGSGSYIAGTGYPVGEYTLWVMDYYGTQKGIISNRIEIEIVDAASVTSAPPATSAPATSAPATSAPATSTPTGMTISVDKLTFTEGESIVVSYDGYDVAGDHDVEIRLVKGHNMSHSDMLAIGYRHDYTDVSDNYSANTKQDTTVAITASGKRAFPDDGYGNVAVVPGVYSIAAYDYSDGAKQISNLIEITVVAAGASQSPSAAPSATPGATNQPTGDSSMFMVVALVALCAGACVVFFKKRCSE